MRREDDMPGSGDAAAPPPRVVIVTLGDPMGIGPEITAKALAGPAGRALMSQPGMRVVLIGDEASLCHAAERMGEAGVGAVLRGAGGAAPVWTVTDASRELGRAWMHGKADVSGHMASVLRGHAPGEALLLPLECVRHSPPELPGPSAWGGRVSFEAVDLAIAVARAARATGGERGYAIVTAPISKTAWRLAREEAETDAVRERMGSAARWPHGFPGHTELLAERFEAPESGMMFFGPSMRVALATVHVPLREVGCVLQHDPERVLRAIRLASKGCAMAGVPRPRIAVCGVNPHAGEGGLLGDEDEHLVAPQVLLAQREGIDAHGPLPADTLFGRAMLKDGRRVKDDGFDAVVAMYHDQGLIPCKLVDGYRAVNVTVGLPEGIIRTSPAHGTAYDIAGRNAANPESMVEAIRASGLLVV